MNAYQVSAFLPLASGHLFCLVLRVSAAAPIEWVRKNADEIARLGIAQDRTARHVNGGHYIALAVEVAA